MTEFGFTGRDLIERFAWRGFQYFDHLQKGNLQPHDPVTDNRIIAPDTEHGKGVIASFEQFPPKTLEEYEEILRIESIRAWEIHRRQEIYMKSGKMKNTVSEKKIREEARIVYDHHLMELNGCIKKSFTLSRYKEEAVKQFIEAEKWLFKTADVLAFEKKHGLERVEKHTQSDPLEPVSKAVFPCDPRTKWGQIEMALMPAGDKFMVKTPLGHGYYDHIDLKLHNDKMKSKKPNSLWYFLETLANMNGFLSTKGVQNFEKISSDAKRLNKHLKQLFGINESIYKDRCDRIGGYKTKFNISHISDDNTMHNGKSLIDEELEDPKYSNVKDSSYYPEHSAFKEK